MKSIVVAIYQIENKIDNRVYIGSAMNLWKRWKAHRSELRLGKHKNTHLQNFVNKYGLEALVFTVLEETTKDKLIALEQQYLDECESPMFNIAAIAEASFTGRKHSEETIELIRKSKIGVGLGIKRPQHVKDALLKANIGRVKSEAEKNLRAANLPSRKPMVAYEGAILIEEDSLTEMSYALGTSPQNLSCALKKGYKCKGFTIEQLK
jgi:group I intron endonuclease